MALQIRKAERRKAKLRLALIGPTGSGKTMSALKMAFGMGGKVGLIDTEHGSGDLYADLGDYDVIPLEAPFTVPKYREAISTFEQAGYDVIIVDSLTHAWAGEGGLLDKQGQVEKRIGNSFSAWREVTPEHNRLVEELIGSPSHVIVTLRVKTEYVLEKNDRGKMEPRKVGLSPVFRDGIEYEMTVCMDVNAEHVAHASKDRTRLFDGWYDMISEETGRKLRSWLDSGVEVVPPPAPVQETKRKTWAELLDEIETALSAAADRDAVVAVLNSDDAAKAQQHATNGHKERLDKMIQHALSRTDNAPPIDNAPENEESWPDADEAQAAA